MELITILVTCMFVLVAVFQVLLALGFPLGEYALGGYHKILPKGLRLMSGVNAVVLLFMGFIFLQHTNIIEGISVLPTNLLVWIVTVFLGLNTIANLVSRSKKERLVMTPLSGLTFILCLIIVLS
ncbi:hypothetical protein [Ornithinibacillus scapharcae]|uniref:hypothetical protein n=1 Tax=Ornithinibacillus scapharcae TaxID=1147159 RepID=UPI000225B83A|nr:hypothetical protein [Ornithinibacillus scapharcae]